MASELQSLLEIADADALKAMLNPDWGRKGRVHDWRNYIPEVLQTNWELLSFDARLVAYAMAEQQAGREEWD